MILRPDCFFSKIRITQQRAAWPLLLIILQVIIDWRGLAFSWPQIEAAVAASESAFKDKAAALAAADAAAAAEASKAQALEEARWKEANEKLAALQKQLQVGYVENLTTASSHT
jgi:hypothetical protein